MKKEQLRQSALCAVLMIFTAQLHINIFDSGFIISVAIVLLPVSLLLWGKFPVLATAAAAGAGNFILRTTLSWLDTGTLRSGYWQEIVFYIAYGALLALCVRKIRWTVEKWEQLLPLAAIDYLSNLAELAVRGGALTAPSIHLGLAVVALLRTALVIGAWLILQRQNLSLLKREHIERYHDLMLLFSRLRGEMLWMQKSSAMMEETMSTAFRLYTCLLEEGSPHCKQALSISKDIHEIKKEYQTVLRGLTEALQEDMAGSETAGFQDIWYVLYENSLRTARHAETVICWDIRIELDFQTGKPYQLLSILRNLLDNAIEAAEDGQIRIDVWIRREGENDVFTITNWGRSIPPEVLPHIFDPGFSTKLNYATGQVGRGVGLCLVRDLTEQELGGSIQVETGDGKVSFTVSISASVLEESA